MNIYDMAKKNYGRTWTIEMIAKLVALNKLTPEQFKEITGVDYVI